MKTYFFILILSLPTFFFGQVVNHFENIDSKWNVAKTFPEANQQNPNFVATKTTVFGFKGDTIINGESWFKLYSSKDSLFQNSQLFIGLIKNDNNKVFFIDTLNQIDTLYDFSLNIGDSVLFNINGVNPEWLYVSKIDSIQINEVFYKRLFFTEPSLNAFDKLNEIWIESIGSIHGPLFPNLPTKFSQEIPDSLILTCTFSIEQNIYHNSSFSNCYINILLSIEHLEDFVIKIYPNPFNDFIFFDNIELMENEIFICNNLGVIVKKQQINNKTNYIDLTELNSGIYFLKSYKNNGANTIKLVKY